MFNKNLAVIALLLVVVGLFAIGSFVSASSVSFFYSPSCGHCQSVSPLIQQFSQQSFSSNWKWNFYDVSQGSYNISGVPTIKIKTSDCRDITLVGSGEIPKYLKCELQEMSTKECMTSTQLNPLTNSFFR